MKKNQHSWRRLWRRTGEQHGGWFRVWESVGGGGRGRKRRRRKEEGRMFEERQTVGLGKVQKPWQIFLYGHLFSEIRASSLFYQFSYAACQKRRSERNILGEWTYEKMMIHELKSFGLDAPKLRFNLQVCPESPDSSTCADSAPSCALIFKVFLPSFLSFFGWSLI